jgi:hypothetical protein
MEVSGWNGGGMRLIRQVGGCRWMGGTRAERVVRQEGGWVWVGGERRESLARGAPPNAGVVGMGAAHGRRTDARF